MFRVNGKGMQQEIAQYAFDSYSLQSLFCAYIDHGPCNTFVILLSLSKDLGAQSSTMDFTCKTTPNFINMALLQHAFKQPLVEFTP